MTHAHLAIVASLVALPATACISDPPPEPSEAPIEIMATGSSVCEPSEGLTWVAGTHEVIFIQPEQGRVRVLLLDSTGRTVLKRRGDWMYPSTVTLSPGRYRLRCTYSDGSSASSTLIVTSS